MVLGGMEVILLRLPGPAYLLAGTNPPQPAEKVVAAAGF